MHRDHDDAAAARLCISEVLQVLDVDASEGVGALRRHRHDVHPGVREVAHVASNDTAERTIICVGYDVAQVLAQRVKAARSRQQQRVCDSITQPVRRPLRQHSHDTLGAAIRVVRNHAVPLPRAGFGRGRRSPPREVQPGTDPARCGVAARTHHGDPPPAGA